MAHRYSWRTAILEGALILATAFFVVPMFLLVNLSLKHPNDPSRPFELPQQPTMQNYATAWVEGNLGNALVNSVVVSIVSVTIVIIASALASYALARVTARWSRVTFVLFLVGLLLPFQLALIPLYTTMRDLGLLGTLWSLILFHVGSQMPFSVFLYTTFLRAVPLEYEEAASIDGAGRGRAFWSIVFPLMRPVTGTLAVINVIATWNEFLTSLLYLSGSGQQTLPVSVFTFVGQYVSQWNVVFAGLVISIAPILIAYFVMQRTVIQGFASGLKG